VLRASFSFLIAELAVCPIKLLFFEILTAVLFSKISTSRLLFMYVEIFGNYQVTIPWEIYFVHLDILFEEMKIILVLNCNFCEQ